MIPPKMKCWYYRYWKMKEQVLGWFLPRYVFFPVKDASNQLGWKVVGSKGEQQLKDLPRHNAGHVFSPPKLNGLTMAWFTCSPWKTHSFSGSPCSTFGGANRIFVDVRCRNVSRGFVVDCIGYNKSHPNISLNVYLGGGWTNPSEKYESKWESSPSFGVNIKKSLSYHHLVSWCTLTAGILSLSNSSIKAARVFWGKHHGAPVLSFHEPRSAGLMEEILKDYYKVDPYQVTRKVITPLIGVIHIDITGGDPTLYTAWNLRVWRLFSVWGPASFFWLFFERVNDILLMEDIIKPVDMQNIGLAVLCDRFLVGGFNPFEKLCSSNWIISPGRHVTRNQRWIVTLNWGDT